MGERFTINFAEGLKCQIEVGANGNWYVDGKDTGCKAQGEKGDKGDEPQVWINSAGRWTVDGIDTGKVASMEFTKFANNLTTTTAGYALDARQGKELYDMFKGLLSMPLIKCGNVTAKYSSSTQLVTSTIALGDGFDNKTRIVATWTAQAGTPYGATTKVLPSVIGADGNFTLTAYGSGYVSGHVLSINYIAMRERDA